MIIAANKYQLSLNLKINILTILKNIYPFIKIKKSTIPNRTKCFYGKYTKNKFGFIFQGLKQKTCKKSDKYIFMTNNSKGNVFI